MFGLPESFRGAGSVAPGETGWQVRSSHVLVQEASVETIAVPTGSTGTTSCGRQPQGSLLFRME
jgi:hypothetical protein